MNASIMVKKHKSERFGKIGTLSIVSNYQALPTNMMTEATDWEAMFFNSLFYFILFY